MIVDAFKPFSVTPKELVDEVILKYGAKKGAFSGRLDPMACGVTRIYLDDSCKLAPECDKLDKIYRFIMVFGMCSSSCDLLGFPECGISTTPPTHDILDRCIIDGEVVQKQPIHSSLPVRNSKGEKNPLWWWALNGRIDEVKIPSFKRVLYNHKIINISKIPFEVIKKTAIDRIGLIDKKHDFKQYAIIDAWRTLHSDQEFFWSAELQVTVSSGFYIRQLVSDIGTALGVKTITFEIERTGYVKN